MSTRGRKPHALTPEESLYLDGRLPPEEARQLEHRLAADPERAAVLDQYRDAMDVWRDDTERATDAVTADLITDRVLAAVEASAGPVLRSQRTTSIWYAAAAVALLAVGVAGTFMARPAPAAGVGIDDARSYASLQDEVIESMISHAVLNAEGR